MPHKIDETCCKQRHCNLCDKYRKELEQYQELEEQGRLIKLPFAIGDIVYELQKNRQRIQPLVITSIILGDGGTMSFKWELWKDIGVYEKLSFSSSHLNESVFLTKEEAEQALKALGESEG